MMTYGMPGRPGRDRARHAGKTVAVPGAFPCRVADEHTTNDGSARRGCRLSVRRDR